jgi:hypothetical protein
MDTARKKKPRVRFELATIWHLHSQIEMVYRRKHHSLGHQQILYYAPADPFYDFTSVIVVYIQHLFCEGGKRYSESETSPRRDSISPR